MACISYCPLPFCECSPELEEDDRMDSDHGPDCRCSWCSEEDDYLWDTEN